MPRPKVLFKFIPSLRRHSFIYWYFNPKNLIVITDKPTTEHKQMEQTAEAKDAMMQVTKKLEVLTTVPTKKYPYAMTASQEIGWDNDTMFNVHKPKYNFNKITCAETRYANAYYTDNSRSPFAQAKVNVEPKK